VKSKVRLLVWDTEFFSKRIATINDINNIELIDLVGFELITNKVASDNYSELNKLTRLGFVLAEGELIFVKKLTDLQYQNQAIEVADMLDTKELVSLAKISYVSTRFRQPWFSDEQRADFYGTWIEKSIKGEFDDVCLIIKHNGKIQGFISLKKEKNSIRVGLIAVAIDQQGKGVARQLLASAEAYALDCGVSHIAVATQASNITAINLYIRNNYSLQESNYWLYKA
jgi:dTDP-4-amino-4,6-dideoxy-D-galactose acyltransferase